MLKDRELESNSKLGKIKCDGVDQALATAALSLWEHSELDHKKAIPCGETGYFIRFYSGLDK